MDISNTIDQYQLSYECSLFVPFLLAFCCFEYVNVGWRAFSYNRSGCQSLTASISFYFSYNAMFSWKTSQSASDNKCCCLAFFMSFAIQLMLNMGDAAHISYCHHLSKTLPVITECVAYRLSHFPDCTFAQYLIAPV